MVRGARLRRTWRQHQVIVERGGQRIAVHAGRHLGRHEGTCARMLLVPAMTRNLSRLQGAHFAPGTQGIALFGGAFRMVAHAARRTLPQAIGMVEQHQGMRRHRRRMGRARVAGTKKPAHPAARQQAAHEGRIGLVMLHHELALRIAFRFKKIRIHILEGMGQDAVAAYPFIQQQLDDLDIALAAKHARIDALFHDGKYIGEYQLIAGQAAIAVAGAGLGDDAAHAAQLALVGDHIERGRQAPPGWPAASRHGATRTARDTRCRRKWLAGQTRSAVSGRPPAAWAWPPGASAGGGSRPTHGPARKMLKNRRRHRPSPPP